MAIAIILGVLLIIAVYVWKRTVDVLMKTKKELEESKVWASIPIPRFEIETTPSMTYKVKGVVDE